MEILTADSSKLPWEQKDVDTRDWFLVGSTTQVPLIVASYLAFVLLIGPRLMKNRPPFQLTGIILVYNILQVLGSVFMLHVGVGLLYNIVTRKEQCVNDSKELQYMYFSALHIYFLAKLTELLDTIFFVLRKKDRQVSFLHVYHHSVVFFYSWALLSYKEAFVFVTVIGFMNSFVHLIMYSYYALSVLPSISKYLWWKKYITKIQMIQFSLMIAYILFEYTTSPCKLPKSVATHLLFNISLVFALFVNFYIQTYKSSQNSKKS
ncbi:elongation of very long chain fatty acids protein 2-like [Aricia agestis]|uniref:elongation of very long chain fatty acids protein 2-like n=1 Tax=Aricia agestis TaxID=91739 RepID=UPI001C206132|nr:elongation of very long chain fatty acids protein 2-like [Aricia agestis]